MKATAVVAELQHIIDTDGDYEVEISCAKPDPLTETELGKQQRYLISNASFIVVENYAKEDGGKTIMIRDWPY